MTNGNKDYEDYLSAIEKRINGEKQIERKSPYESKNGSKLKKRKIRAYLARAVAVFVVVLIALIVIFSCKSCSNSSKQEEKNTTVKTQKTAVKTDNKTKKVPKISYASYNKNSKELDGTYTANNILFINTKKNNVLAYKNAKQKCYPASTTKVMTLLVAVENIKDYDDTFVMTYKITDPLYKEGATVAGFSAGEKLNMYDLIYGTILPSGGDACLGLAEKIAGSEENFVKLMNNKAKEMGLKNTHFTNCTGLFDSNHYTTAEDMAVILRTAMSNKLCKKVLSTYKYTTSKTDKHENGLELENTLFKYMYGTEPEKATILGGKTGFVNESRYCIVSFGEDKKENEYVCITLGAESRWPCVYDQINLYKNFCK